MTKPSVDRERLEAVQRAARYILSRDTLGQTRFTASDIFPPELGQPPATGSTEYAWRQQLAWAWARAGFLHEAVTGTGLQKRRIYTMLQAGREALEQITSDPVLASFYIRNLRTAGGAAPEHPQTFYRPPDLRLTPPANLHLVKKIVAGPIAKAAAEEIEAPSDDEALAAPEIPIPNEDLLGLIGELRGLPVFFERITDVLVRMDERLTKVEDTAKDQSALLVEATRAISGGPKDGRSAPATREDLATALAELTTAFVKDKPDDGAALAALGTRISQHEQFHRQLAGEIANLIAVAKKPSVPVVDAKTLGESVVKDVAALGAAIAKDALLRKAIAEEVSAALAGDGSLVLVKNMRRAVAEEIGSNLAPVFTFAATSTKADAATATSIAALSARFDAHVLEISKDVQQRLGSRIGSILESVEQRMGALLSSVEKRLDAQAAQTEATLKERLTNIAPDVNALRELSERISSEISTTCEELREDLSSMSADTQDLAERVEAVTDGFELGHAEFRRQGQVVVEGFKDVAGAAQAVMDGAHAAAKEMIALGRIRAMGSGVSFEEAAEAAEGALDRLIDAKESIVRSSTALGGGLIRPLAGDAIKPVILQDKKEPS